MRHSRNKPINLLIVEDDLEIRTGIVSLFEKEYVDVINLYLAGDVGQALNIIRTKEIDAIILDIVMPYGDASKELREETDPDGLNAGLRLLHFIRSNRSAKEPPIWVAVITARSNPTLLQECKKLVGDSGKIFIKPFNDILLEYLLCGYFEIEFRGPKILVPEDVLEHK